MKTFFPWKLMPLAAVFLGIFVFSHLFIQTPSTQVQAQDMVDIDEVMEQFGGDFGFNNKDDLKQQNKQSANEQNREDIQLKLEEERKRLLEQANQPQASPPNPGNPPPPPPPVMTANVSITFTEMTPPTPFALNVDIQLGSAPLIPGQVLPVGTPVPINFGAVPVGAHVLTIKCNTGPACDLVLSGLVNTTCSPTSFVGGSAISVGSTGISNCTVSAPPPPPSPML